MDLPGYDIRFSELDDLGYLNFWFSEPPSCDDFPFTFDEKEEALKNWIGFSKYHASLTAVVDGVPCGVGTLFLMPYRKVAHHASFYVIVDPAKRRKGIGTSLVRNVMHLARTRFRLEGLHVEIFLPSLMEGILQTLGFKEFARQDNFMRLENKEGRPRVLLEHFFV